MDTIYRKLVGFGSSNGLRFNVWKLFIVLLLLLSSEAVMSQHLQNGGFEEPEFTSPPFHKYIPSDTVLPSWTLSSTGSGEPSYVMDFVSPDSPYADIEGATGAHALRLSYGDSISQTISNLTPGARYELSLAVHGETNLGPLQVVVYGTTNEVPIAPSGRRSILFQAAAPIAPLSIRAVAASPEIDFNVMGITVDSLEVERSHAPASLEVALHPGLTIAGDIGATYRIEYASSIAPTNWNLLTTVVLTSSPALFYDSTPVQEQKRFYRAVSVPAP
ncbi:MAG TPA: DUF642 domain-containing protein [Verrucomicrobiota bacterium]|jgi:hypothetical protein|nr:DUF642 domain-containing protein [Verrucomicrobiota bacterium]HQL77847.1 DUF642 domain-containing protein [Verrucomicrobiota bacterium]